MEDTGRSGFTLVELLVTLAVVALLVTVAAPAMARFLDQARLRERGFNQATELARRLGRTLGVRHAPQMCTRHRNTRPQSLLPVTARRLNLRNAFSITGRLPAAHVAIIDDVMTSGHTSDELARTLKRAGAEYVEIWVVARAGR